MQYDPDDGVLEVFGKIVLLDPNVIDHGARATASYESQYYISDRFHSAKPLAQAIRYHWSTENGQHWILDVTFSERYIH